MECPLYVYGVVSPLIFCVTPNFSGVLESDFIATTIDRIEDVPFAFATVLDRV